MQSLPQTVLSWPLSTHSHPPPCSSTLCLFFLRAAGGTASSPAAPAFLHRPKYSPLGLSGQHSGPPPQPVLLPPAPLPKLANLRPGPFRVSIRLALLQHNVPWPALHCAAPKLPCQLRLLYCLCWACVMLVVFFAVFVLCSKWVMSPNRVKKQQLLLWLSN